VATHAPARVTRAARAELLHGIYVILNDEPRMLELARAVLDAGVRAVQYRAKRGIVEERIRALRELTRERDTLLIVNDEWRAADEFDCDGVHLGPGDPGFDRVTSVRGVLRERLIGLSCGTIGEIRDANGNDVDYVGVGSIYATSSKNDAGAPIGIESLRSLVAHSRVPVAAIGGITAATVPAISRSGAAMAAVISAISTAVHPQRAARELVDAWNRSGDFSP
jgi:thiamine-phosphate pyrophosphorylase